MPSLKMTASVNQYVQQNYPSQLKKKYFQDINSFKNLYIQQNEPKENIRNNSSNWRGIGIVMSW